MCAKERFSTASACRAQEPAQDRAAEGPA
jgi:hypothetical protein